MLANDEYNECLPVFNIFGDIATDFSLFPTNDTADGTVCTSLSVTDTVGLSIRYVFEVVNYTRKIVVAVKKGEGLGKGGISLDTQRVNLRANYHRD